jgi:hypothetical protein
LVDRQNDWRYLSAAELNHDVISAVKVTTRDASLPVTHSAGKQAKQVNNVSDV